MLVLFHISVLCSTTLDGLIRVKKYFFQKFFCLSVIVLIHIMGICCGPLDFFCLGGQYYGLGHPTVEAIDYDMATHFLAGLCIFMVPHKCQFNVIGYCVWVMPPPFQNYPDLLLIPQIVLYCPI